MRNHLYAEVIFYLFDVEIFKYCSFDSWLLYGSIMFSDHAKITFVIHFGEP
ncbi:hypothetical protein Geoth_3283 [Parageobacillus thermoglucosidasius C56-YS93]|nr:hypothetical protein Geoth_3283 [Parageobacillus thermoglucosidasius C56-YS93]